MKIDEELFKKAYKKLKSSVYYDKTQLILRNKIVEYESSGDIDEKISQLFENIKTDDSPEIEEILESISVSYFPKKLSDDKKDIIMNLPSKEIKVEEFQHFINMDVEGHILGVVWLLLIGYRIDAQVYDHSYGNRIRKNLHNEISEDPTYSPYLFEPYFQQYESWRDIAMDEASKHLDLKQDVVIMTMDFRRYYYSIDVNEKAFSQMYDEFTEASEELNTEIINPLYKRINDFTCAVVEKYSQQFGDEFDKRHILPIGFLPSNVISNWCLRNFDKAIVDGWNPLYYGRYVDDVLIVDKVEHNSDVYQKSKKGELGREDVIDFFLRKCSKWGGLDSSSCEGLNDRALIQVDEEETQKAREANPKKTDSFYVYRVNHKYNPLPDDESNIIVHNDKVKIFYFATGETDALITCFKNNISKNKSEFRHLP